MISHYLIKPNTVKDKDTQKVHLFISKHFFSSFIHKSIRLSMHTHDQRYSKEHFESADDYYLFLDPHSSEVEEEEASLEDRLSFVEFSIPKGSHGQLEYVFNETAKKEIKIFTFLHGEVIFFNLPKEEFVTMDLSTNDWKSYATLYMEDVKFFTKVPKHKLNFNNVKEYPVTIKEAHSPQAVKTYRLLLISTLK